MLYVLYALKNSCGTYKMCLRAHKASKGLLGRRVRAAQNKGLLRPTSATGGGGAAAATTAATPAAATSPPPAAAAK